MPRRNLVFFCGILFFFGSLILMFKQLDRQQGREGISHDLGNYGELNLRLVNLEKELKQSKSTLKKLKSGLNELAELSHVSNLKSSNREEVFENILGRDPSFVQKFPRIPVNFSINANPICQDLNYFGPKTDIDMNRIYQDLDWKDVNGGVWKQGFYISTSDSEWAEKKLKIHLVPHSHNDPGWLKTYEDYFNTQTRHILDNVIDYLSLDRKRRFVWAEMSYLSMWYDIADANRKEKARDLIQNGQFEIVTGGWVMNDEANTHYYAMIDQMIEGHEWLSKTFNVIPKSGWAIDPFGHTPVMAYLLNRMGLTNMLIQRVHYSVKKRFAQDKTLEFRWRQEWDKDSSTDIICHMMPFYSYDIPHTCGPDPKICCQFDFGRLPGMRRSCPWGSAPKAINDGNIEERANTLLDQYRKKSKLFKTDTLLVPLGDDFRYDKISEIEAQFMNYGKIFEYINSHPELHAEAKFSTLSEYFEAMTLEIGGQSNLPSLSGDFFTYSDRQDHYWSGYYTSRPFYKTQERHLEAHLRGAEILYSLAYPVARTAGVAESFSNTLYPLLKKSRRYLGLFQHHDGITGTSKDPVVNDYGRKIQLGIMNAKEIISRSAELLLLRDSSSFKTDKPITLDYDTVLSSHNQPMEKIVIPINRISGQPTTVVIYNSLSHDRTGLVSLIVTDTKVQVQNSQGEVVPSQINIIWSDAMSSRLDQYQIVFPVTVAATGLATYSLSHMLHPSQNSLSTVKILNIPGDKSLQHSEEFLVETLHTSTKEILLENEELFVFFSSINGLMKAVTTKRDSLKMEVRVDFQVYAARSAKETSGAYLFLPQGPSMPYLSSNDRPVVRVIEGPLLKEVQVLLPHVEHVVSLHVTNKEGPTPYGIFIKNIVDIRVGMDNKELVMRINAPDAADSSGNYFFTDLNGLQIHKRRTMLDKIPIQANFYPMPTMAFIQNRRTRLSVLTAQPRGVASLEPSQIDIVLDRRLMQDDNRGMAQAMKDNLKTSDHFVILIERWNHSSPTSPAIEAEIQYPSILAHHSLLNILHPPWIMRYKDVDPSQVLPRFKHGFAPLPGSDTRSGDTKIPCNIHILNLRSLESKDRSDVPSEESALILQNFGHECLIDTHVWYRAGCSIGNSMNWKILYPTLSVRNTSLSLQFDGKDLSITSDMYIEPMEIKSFKVHLK